MIEKYVYFYFMKNVPEQIREAVPLHAAYWKGQKLNGYSGGPFADRTGGLIIFESSNIDKAIELAEKDPFVEHGVIDRKWVKKWIQE